MLVAVATWLSLGSSILSFTLLRNGKINFPSGFQSSGVDTPLLVSKSTATISDIPAPVVVIVTARHFIVVARQSRQYFQIVKRKSGSHVYLSYAQKMCMVSTLATQTAKVDDIESIKVELIRPTISGFFFGSQTQIQ